MKALWYEVKHAVFRCWCRTRFVPFAWLYRAMIRVQRPFIIGKSL